MSNLCHNHKSRFDAIFPFVDSQNDNYRPDTNSPSINTGDEAASYLRSYDQDGKLKSLDGDGVYLSVLDMGAFE